MKNQHLYRQSLRFHTLHRQTLRPFGAALVAASLSLSLASGAHADEAAAPSAPAPSEASAASPAPASPAPASPAPASPAPAAKPAPYSLPWQLRPALAVNVLRSDTSIGFYEDASGNKGTTAVSFLLGSYKVLPDMAVWARVGIVGNYPPTGASATSVVNPALGFMYSLKLHRDVRLALWLGFALPFGHGGGDTPNPARAAATRSGIADRSAMDNAMFAVNDFVVFPGIDLAYIAHKVTVQVEATVLQLSRVRGSAVQADSQKTNFTTGLHVGYFVIPQLSLGAELRYQRWLTTPAAVTKDGTQRDNLSIAAGIRGHFKLPKKIFIRPGISYSRGLDDPMAKNNYNIVQVDVPVIFP